MFIHTCNTGRAAYTGIPRRWHAIVMRRLHQTRSGPVSFPILRLLRPRRCRFRGAAGEVLITASSRAVRRCGTIVVLLTSRRRRRRGPGRLQQPCGSRATPRRALKPSSRRALRQEDEHCGASTLRRRRDSGLRSSARATSLRVPAARAVLQQALCDRHLGRRGDAIHSRRSGRRTVNVVDLPLPPPVEATRPPPATATSTSCNGARRANRVGAGAVQWPVDG